MRHYFNLTTGIRLSVLALAAALVLAASLFTARVDAVANASISITPSEGPYGSILNVSGAGFAANDHISGSRSS